MAAMTLGNRNFLFKKVTIGLKIIAIKNAINMGTMMP